MTATDPSPLACLRVPADNTLGLKVQATKVEPRADAQLSVTVTVLIKASDTDQTVLETTERRRLNAPN